MDECEFRNLLELFPVVRSRDYHLRQWRDAWNEGDGEKSRSQGSDLHDAFWKKLKLAAEKKVGKAEAEKFCETFRRIHVRLVSEEEQLSLDAVQSCFLKS